MGRYHAYPEYKNSGVEWIGNYPKQWTLTRIKFESYVKARVGWHGLKSDDFTYEGPYLVTGSDFKGPFIQWENCYHCELSRYEQDPYIQLRDGDLLITKDGTIGKVALVSGLNGLATLNSGVFVVRPLSNNYISRFYFWLLQSSVFTGFVDFNKTGSTIVHLYQDTFVNFTFAMPELIVQEKIANFLDHETAKIDTLIKKQQQLIQLLKEKRQAVISHAVTKGLNPNTPMKDSGVEWLGVVPEHWKVASLKYLVSAPIIDGPHLTPTKRDEGIPFISAEAVSQGYINFDKKWGYISEDDHKLFSKRYSPQRGDILVVKLGATTGVSAIVETDEIFNVWVPLATIRSKKSVPAKFIFYLLQSVNVRDAFQLSWTFGTQQTLGLGTLANLSFPVPPEDEALKIVEYIESKIPSFDELVSRSEESLSLLKERRTVLISAAVTGKIDVRNWQTPKN